MDQRSLIEIIKREKLEDWKKKENSAWKWVWEKILINWLETETIVRLFHTELFLWCFKLNILKKLPIQPKLRVDRFGIQCRRAKPNNRRVC